MAVYGHLLRLRLFLEGVEVPVVAAQIQSQKNSPAVASIQIPANDYALDLRPRTLVHLFMYDIYNGVPAAETLSINSPGAFTSVREDGIDPEAAGLFPPERFESSPEQDETDLTNENYKLIFGGEIIGFAFTKSPTSRSITLQCLDWSSYWDIAYQYQMSGFSFGGAGVRGSFSGAATTVFNDFLEGSADIVSKIMNTPPRSYPNMSGTLMSGLMHIIEAIGGIYYGKRAIRGVNDFFSLAEIRLHLTQMVGASPYTSRDERRLMAAHGFGSLFRRNLAGLGRQVSIRQILLALQRYIFHEIIPITSPRYIPPLYDPNLPRFETHGLDQDPETAPLARIAERVRDRALDLKERLARCVTTEDAELESKLRGGNLRAELLSQNRVCVRAGRLARAVGRGRAGSPLTDFWGIPTVAANFETAAERWGGRTGGIGSMLRGPRDVRTLPTRDNPTSRDVSRILDEIISLMTRALEAQVRRRIQRTTQQPDPPPRLLSQIYRPDAWMVSPPRCNVMFPELYSSFSYSRNYMAETTRLLLRTHSAFFGSDVLFDGYYMAPSTLLGARSNKTIINGRDPELTNADYPLHVRRDMLDHELYTGIIPTFERMSDLNLHALRGGYYEFESDNGGVIKLGYAQLACNFIFFQQRFQSRQLQLAGKFNPYCVLGFPMLVIDRYLPTDSLRESTYSSAVAARLAEAIADGEGIRFAGMPQERVDEQLAAESVRIYDILSDVLQARPNTHYLGTPEVISHNLDAQSGGTTQIQMSYARTTNERTEFLGDNVGTTARRTRNVRITTEVAALTPPMKGDVGFRGGKILEVTDVTTAFLRRVARSRSRRTATAATQAAAATPGAAAQAAATTQGTAPTVTPPSSQRVLDRTAPLYVADTAFRGRARRGTRVRIGIEQRASLYGPEVVALVGAGGLFNSSAINRAPWSASRSAGAGGSVYTETVVTFRAYRIVEELGAYRREAVDMPPELITFPPWYGDQWRSERVGGLYAYFFGVGAITDPIRVIAGSSDSSRADTGATTTPEEVDRTLSVAVNEEFATLISQLASGEFNEPRASSPQPGLSEPAVAEGETLGPAGRPDTPTDKIAKSAVLGSQERSSIAEATEELVRIYSLIRLNQFDVHQFIKSYTWRPIASMVDLFGTANLQIADDGSVTQGVEGFHSRAFGDFDDLRRIIGPGDGTRPRTILGLTIRDPDETSGAEANRARRDQNISARLDTRKEKRTAVLRYLYTMYATCGVLG